MSKIIPSSGGDSGGSIDPGNSGDIPVSDGLEYNPTDPGDILGTANQISVTGGTNATTGPNVTLSLPASINIDALGLNSLTLLTPLVVGSGGTGLSALGTGLQMLRVNAGATALEYFTPAYAASGANTDITSLTGLTQGGFFGSKGLKTVTSGSTTLTASDGNVINLDNSGGTITITLPAANAVPVGYPITFYVPNSNANAITVQRAGADTIGNATSRVFGSSAPGAAWHLVSDGVSNWIPTSSDPFITASSVTNNVPYSWQNNQGLKQQTVAVAGGGTGATTLSSGGVLTGNGTGAITAGGTVTSGTWNGTAIGGAYGGTGTNYGMGLVGGFSTVTDTSGTVNLTATDAGLRYMNQGASALTYNLPAAASCPGKVFVFKHTTSGAQNGDLTFTPAVGEYIDASTSAVQITEQWPAGACGVLQSDGVSGWYWLLYPNAGWSSGPGAFYKNTAGFERVGTLPVGQGGTGATTLTSGGVLTGNGTSAITAGGTVTSGVWNAGNVTSSGTLTATSGDITATNGNLSLGTAGKGILIKEGSNATMGLAVLSSGTVTVSTTKVTANSRIILTTNVPGGTVGFPIVSSRSAGASFDITSKQGDGTTQTADTSSVAWVILEPS